MFEHRIPDQVVSNQFNCDWCMFPFTSTMTGFAYAVAEAPQVVTTYCYWKCECCIIPIERDSSVGIIDGLKAEESGILLCSTYACFEI